MIILLEIFGNDSLNGGSGDDSLIGGLGTDTAVFSDQDNQIDLRITTSQNTGDGNDSFRFNRKC